MTRLRTTILAAAAGAALCLTAPACSSDKGATQETIGSPPRTNDKLSPRDSSADDPNADRKVAPERLNPSEGGEDGGTAPEKSEGGADEDGDPSLARASADLPGQGRAAGAQEDNLLFQGEARLANLRMLTHGGQNAEAYLSPSETQLVFQSTRDDLQCDQIFTMKIDGSEPRLVSTGTGATTCAYFLPDGQSVLYASTHKADPACPPKPDFGKFGGYVWPIHDTFDIYVAPLAGGPPRILTSSPGYDAEATVSPKGDRIVFTSTRDGDLDLYSMKIDGSDVRRLTQALGYDGGAFFSQDGRQIVYRAHHPTGEEANEYKRLLKEGVVKPSVMELFVMNADGSGSRQITAFGAASFAPFFHPDGKRVIFASNLHDPKGRDFDLYTVRVDGSGLERITYNPSFDGFPMFTADGKKLVFASNRAGKVRGETNVFVADWVE